MLIVGVRYGYEVARLTQAKSLAKRGYELAKQSRVAPAVLGDIKVRLAVTHCTVVYSWHAVY